MLQRLHRLDRALLLVLVPLWLLCFALGVRSAVSHAGSTPVRVTFWQSPDEYPEIVQFAPFVPVEEESGLRRGDRIVRLSDQDLRGANGLQVNAGFRALAWNEARIPVVYERDGRLVETRVPAVDLSMIAPLLFVAPVALVFAIVLLLKAPGSRAARSSFYLMLAFAFAMCGHFSGPGLVGALGILVFSLSQLVAVCLAARWVVLFPYGVMPESGWLRWLPVPFGCLGLAVTSTIFGIPFSVPYAEPILGVGMTLASLAAAVVLNRTYRRSDPVGRRRLKWSVLGLYTVMVPMAVMGGWVALRPQDWETAVYLMASLAFAPPFLYLALYRFDVFDVDRLITATTAYNVVLASVFGAWLYLAPRTGDLASAWLGLPAGVGQLAASAGLAALILPVQRRLRPRLEALFFREQHDLEAALERLPDELGKADDAKGLLAMLGHELHERLRPQSTVLYGRDGDRYSALWVEGRGAPAELPADGPVVATLRGQSGPLCLDGELAGAGSRAQDPFVVAALEVLNAAVVLPIAGAGGEPTTLVCLGPKRSGDVYTATEVHLLRAVADRAALELQRFDERQLLDESRAMQAAMRRYVPGAVADQIERGAEPDAGEREVTVLFVDLRGYVALSEGSDAGEIFSTVNRYTRLVSELVTGTGGTVVEFNGDGMMAVFGSPDALPEKERAAVRAARLIVEEVEGLEHAGRPLSVGIGIATGRSFVGSIQAADRLIWSAIGNTTNLAARLQSMTRELEASILIDATTHAALGDAGRGFRVLEEIAVRGRSDRIDLFALGRKKLAPATAPVASADAAAAELRRRGAIWSASFGGRRIELPDAKGLHYLARLLDSPETDFHVLDLVADVEGVATPTAGGRQEELATARTGASGGDEVLDDAARAAYRERLGELREELDEAEAANDLGRMERTREEMAFLEDELTAATGLGGRTRRTGGHEERARKAVYNRIQHVTKRMESLHLDLAAHLRASVRTGTTCSYRPERPVTWRVDVPR